MTATTPAARAVAAEPGGGSPLRERAPPGEPSRAAPLWPPAGPRWPRLELSAAGAALLVSCAALLVTGLALRSWPVVVWGQVLAGVLVVGRLLARRLLTAVCTGEVRLAVEQAPPRRRSQLAVGRRFELELRVSNTFERPLDAGLTLRCSRGLRFDEPTGGRARLSVPCGGATWALRVVPTRLGRARLLGAELDLRGGWGLFRVRSYWPCEQELLVLWASAEVAQASAVAVAQPRRDRAGPHRLVQTGLGSEFKELRQHRPGDPFRSIEWKASARRRRLMVRELESEMVLDVALLLDISPSMREGPVGDSALDRCAGRIHALSRAALACQDRFGLITYDQRVYGELPPRAGKDQLSRLARHLAGVFDVYDDDLTAVDGRALARHLAEHVRARGGGRLPLPDDEPWAAPFPDELLDFAEAVAGGEQDQLDPGRIRAAHADDRWEDVVRRCCRVLGIVLPYRAREAPGDGVLGLAAALRRAIAERRGGRMLLVASDLGWEGDEEPLVRAIQLARRRCLRLLVLHAAPPAEGRGLESDHERLLARLLAADERRRLPGLRLMARLGVDVLPWARWRHPRQLYQQLRSGGRPQR